MDNYGYCGQRNPFPWWVELLIFAGIVLVGLSIFTWQKLKYKRARKRRAKMMEARRQRGIRTRNW